MAPASIAPVDFQALFERSPGLYLVLDRELRVVAASDAYCRSVRGRREDLLGLRIQDMFPDSGSNPGADGLEKLQESLDRVLRLRRPDTMAIQRFDVARPQREGGGFIEKYWSPRNSPILDDHGEVRWIIHRVYDVTGAVLDPNSDESQRRLAQNRERLILELRRTNEEMARLDALRTGILKMSRLSTMATMASALAHDVSQPLTAARNYLSALRRMRADRDDDARSEEVLAKIAQQIERAGDIVKNLRGFMAANNTVQRPEDVSAVIADAVRLAEAALKSADANLAIAVAADIPATVMDRIQIQQVVVNLLTHAAEAVEGRAERSVTLSVAAANDAVRIAVADTGAGLAVDVARELFEPFATTNLIGPGLGLAIARQIVAEHRGTIEVSPNTPAGTVFTVTLPCAPAVLGEAGAD